MCMEPMYLVKPTKCPPPTANLQNEWKLAQLFKNIVNHNSKYKVAFKKQHILMFESKFFIIFKTLHLVLKKTYQVQKQGKNPVK